MRLTSIKLSGFKSFVEPTTIQVDGQLVGIVGPNGCGKSNIIDAVRLVLGESRATELRGESMRDVIFNGTTLRKPSGRASVELIFDNSESRVFGQWNRYDELAVKRVLTREGGSTYHINNMVVRRRDVQDIFMGTGLGSRAYAIIGQGMISRIIEARPEELRIFLEEAAGVSKYRERRRETENRLHDTRENLKRVVDILREITQNLEKLEVQAAVVREYDALQKAQYEKQNLLWMIQKKGAEDEQSKWVIGIARATTELESMSANLYHRERMLEEFNQSHTVINDQLHTAQGQLYHTNAEIGSIEAQIRYVIESRNRLQVQIGSYQQQRDQWQKQVQGYSDEYDAARLRLTALALEYEQAQEVVKTLASELPEIDEAWRQVQQKNRELRNQIVQLRQKIELASANHKNISAHLSELLTRRDRLKTEKAQLQTPDEEALSAIQNEQKNKEHVLEALYVELAKIQDTHPDIEENRRQIQSQIEKRSTGLAQIKARVAALQQLQERAQSNVKVKAWLTKYELAGLTPVWQQLQIEQGWETALESVLNERMSALELVELGKTDVFFKDPPAAKLSFFSCSENEEEKDVPSYGRRAFFDLLQLKDERITGMMRNWLHNVYVADSMAEALADRHTLPTAACFVLPQGHIIDRYGVRFYAPESEKEGVLARQKEIDQLIVSQQEEESLLGGERERLKQCEVELAACNKQLQEMNKGATDLTRELHAHQLQVVKLTELKERFHQRHAHIESAMVEIASLEEGRRQTLVVEEEQIAQLKLALANVQQQEENERKVLVEKEQGLTAFRQRLRDSENAAQEMKFTKQSLENRIGELERHIQSAQQQTLQMNNSLQQDQLALDSLSDKEAQQTLQVLLDKRLTHEQELSGLRQKLEEVGRQLREAQEQRMLAEKSLQPQRDKIVSLQLKEQASRFNVEQYRQKLAEANADEIALANKILEGVSASVLQVELSRITKAIIELGPVNLAAAGELTEVLKRKNFLEEQHADLSSAIATLEDAIRKIDQETRALLQNTFDQVNLHLAELFPLLFGGGQAKLIMTGEEILDAGVQIMAQPPGKKNTTIHLLSGGEKAMAAIALVFSLFQLNPAPFCLLDEVDAPLDDANTDRFCNMVKRMSDKTQFLFISHNKIAMEMAKQLIGVTMQEQGVSRIVTVDIKEATEFSSEVRTA